MGAEVGFTDFRSIVVPTKNRNQHFGRGLKSEQDPETEDMAYIFANDERDQIMKKLGMVLPEHGLPISGLGITSSAKSAKTVAGFSPLNQEPTLLGEYWVRSGGKVNSFADALKIMHGNKGGICPDIERDDHTAGVAPIMNFDIQKILELRKSLPGFGKIGTVKDDKGKTLYHTIQVGSWPEKIVEESQELEWLYQNERGRFVATGKTFTNVDYEFIAPKNDWDHPYYEYVAHNDNREFLFEDKYYVRAKNHGADALKYTWIKEQPKRWVILNYGDLSKEMNPRGTGKAKTMQVWSGEIMRSDIPYYNTPVRDSANALKQTLSYRDSMVHEYLNGKGAFRECNFLSEALVTPNGLYKTMEINHVADKKRHCVLAPERLQKLHELNREMVREEIQLKHPEIDMAKFYEDLDKMIGYVEQSDCERGL